MNALYRSLAPTIDRLSSLTRMANRTRAVNEALHTNMTPHEIAARFADEDIDLLLAWIDH
jgi:hypothetical protein